MLSQRNKFFCDSCCSLQEAEKRLVILSFRRHVCITTALLSMKIKKLPNVLTLHLKRFKYQEDVQKYIKLTYRVAFPIELRLFNTVDGTEDADRLYNLYAIVVHIGKYVYPSRRQALSNHGLAARTTAIISLSSKHSDSGLFSMTIMCTQYPSKRYPSILATQTRGPPICSITKQLTSIVLPLACTCRLLWRNRRMFWLQITLHRDPHPQCRIYN